jgi:hypothetical protein
MWGVCQHLEDHPLFTVLHISKYFPPSATWGRWMSWWERSVFNVRVCQHLEVHPLFTVLQIRKYFPPSATWGRWMSWWERSVFQEIVHSDAFCDVFIWLRFVCLTSLLEWGGIERWMERRLNELWIGKYVEGNGCVLIDTLSRLCVGTSRTAIRTTAKSVGV